jgi:hypothetical protein
MTQTGEEGRSDASRRFLLVADNAIFYSSSMAVEDT